MHSKGYLMNKVCNKETNEQMRSRNTGTRQDLTLGRLGKKANTIP